MGLSELASAAVLCGSNNQCCPQSHCKNGGAIGSGSNANGGSMCCQNANDEVYAKPNSSSPSGYSYACCNSGDGGSQTLTEVATGSGGVTLSVCCGSTTTAVCPINNMCCVGNCYVSDSSTKPEVGSPSDYACCPPDNAVCDAGAVDQGYYDSSLTFQQVGLNVQACCASGESCLPTKAGAQSICCPTGGQICTYGEGGIVGYSGAGVKLGSESYTNGLAACCASPNQCLQVSDSAKGISVEDLMCCPADTISVCNTHYRLGGKYSDIGGFFDYSCCAGYCKDTKNDIAAELCCENEDDVAGHTENAPTKYICCDKATYSTADTGKDGILCCEKPKMPVQDALTKRWSCQTPRCPPGQTYMPDKTCCPNVNVVHDRTTEQPLFCCAYAMTKDPVTGYDICSHCPTIPKDFCDYGGGCDPLYSCQQTPDGRACNCLPVTPSATCAVIQSGLQYQCAPSGATPCTGTCQPIGFFTDPGTTCTCS